ncbi:MAG: exonuclease [Candidatus Riflebacteria bacterium]|nr:exonuclease [Candidatus Riflebacteria bacterium]
MSFIMVDIESDGPIPGDYSMISLGAVLVDANLDKTFTTRFRPISDRWVPEALAISGFSREATLAFPDPRGEMERFAAWIRSVCPGKPVFVSDNNGYDWQFVNWYFHHFLGDNPFGYSSQNMGSLYKGMVKDMGRNFKHLRKTVHTHDPLDDARGNAEALLHMIREMGLVVPGWPSSPEPTPAPGPGLEPRPRSGP